MYDYFGIFTHHLITQKINTMKRFYFTLVVLCFFTACRHKDCVDVLCLNNGYCSAGDCNCPGGFGGDNCETFLSCETLSPLCPPNATCQMLNNAPVCLCNAGFEGSLCDTLTRSFFTDGSTVYTSHIDCVMPEGSYDTESCVLSNGTAPNEFIVNNFAADFWGHLNVKVYITDSNTCIIPAQTFYSGDLIVVSQDNVVGILDSNNHKITIPYKIDNMGYIELCTLELTRQ